MIYCEIKNNSVVNRVVFDGPMPDDWEPSKTWIASDVAQIGWTYANGELVSPPRPPDPPLPIPSTVKMWQARTALALAGHLPAVEQALTSMPGPAGIAARAAWEYATDISRDSPLVASMTTALGLSKQQVDQLFVQAAALAV